MVLKKPGINVTFEEGVAELLIYLANQDHKSIASVVRELTVQSLEIREDLYLSKIAEKIDKKSTRTYSHDSAWK